MDNSTFYLGSANMDWRSLTQVKELGIVVSSECLTLDLLQIFEIYWTLGQITELPTSTKETLIDIETPIPECDEVIESSTILLEDITTWSYYYQAYFNQTSPARTELLMVNNTKNLKETNQNPFTYLTSAPKDLCGPFRTNDIDGVLNIQYQ